MHWHTEHFAVANISDTQAPRNILQNLILFMN